MERRLPVREHDDDAHKVCILYCYLVNGPTFGDDDKVCDVFDKRCAELAAIGSDDCLERRLVVRRKLFLHRQRVTMR